MSLQIDACNSGAVVENIHQYFKLEETNDDGLQYDERDFELSPLFDLTTLAPNLSERPRIIALCGIAGNVEAARPSEDGRFLSDFYCLKHLLADVSPDQHWISAFSAQQLVDANGRYLHGPANTRDDDTLTAKRRVVLYKENLHEHRDVEVREKKALVPHFLELLHDACKQNSKDNRPVLVFLFGHGSDADQKFALDIRVGDEIACTEFLTVTMVDNVTERFKNVDITYITTACFSGGWTLSKHIQGNVLAASSPWTTSEASKSGGTASSGDRPTSFTMSGSPYIESMVDVLCQISLTNWTNPDGRKFTTLPTYAGFIESVKSQLREKESLHYSVRAFPIDSVSPLRTYGDSYAKVTGLPFKGLDFKYNAMRTAGEAPQSPKRRDDSESPRPRPPHYELIMFLREQATVFKASCPPEHGTGGAPMNKLWGMIRRLFDPVMSHNFYIQELESLRHILEYKLFVQNAATRYKDYLGIQGMERCLTMDVEGTPRPQHLNDIKRVVRAFDLFDKPPVWMKLHYIDTPVTYMALAICKAGWTPDEARTKLATLKNPNTGLSIVPMTSLVLDLVTESQLDLEESSTQRLRNLTQQYLSDTKELRPLSEGQQSRRPLSSVSTDSESRPKGKGKRTSSPIKKDSEWERRQKDRRRKQTIVALATNTVGGYFATKRERWSQELVEPVCFRDPVNSGGADGKWST